ncbi:serine hydrolase [Geothrix sp. PMB-07]|uniref:serine hydrolase domain-containing protein n=1 Tax=Geothrix sp. PMB-07 TaxID=3068640 RepID=UPI002740B9C9|nr:serine hydrolase domain-containing protein [Geothrix sp. PMB-07]WLT32444.1 serine hydrolase domain-containing protein [Geothrix sp. PMB-07]
MHRSFKRPLWILLALASIPRAFCSDPLVPTAAAAVDKVVADNALKHGIPAQAVVVLHNGEPIYRHASGKVTVDGTSPVTFETIFPAYSVSKLVASVLLLQLVEEGKVALDAPASRYVTNLPQGWRAITVEQFLNHVSGVPEFFDPGNPSAPFPPSAPAAFERLAHTPLVDPPDTRTRYTGTDFLVIGAILESVTGIKYGDLARSRIFSPLGLRHTWLGLENVPQGRLVASYHGEGGRLVPDVPVAWPAYSVAHGELFSTADDLATFLGAVARGKLVSQKALLRFWRPHAFPNGDLGYFSSGWEYGENGTWHEVGHDGGAKVRVRIRFQPDLKDHFVFVYLVNGSRDNVWSRTLVESVERIVVPQ